MLHYLDLCCYNRFLGDLSMIRFWLEKVAVGIERQFNQVQSFIRAEEFTETLLPDFPHKPTTLINSKWAFARKLLTAPEIETTPPLSKKEKS